MKISDITIGCVYDIKVGKNTTAVRITKLAASGGWEAVTLSGNKTLLIKSPERLLGIHKEKDAKTPTSAQGATRGDKPGKDAGTRAPKPVQNTLRNKRTSLLDAAAQVLAESKEPLNCKLMVKAISEKGYWQPTHAGKTPVNTLHAAIGAEIKKKGAASRFEKVGRGQFGLRSQ